jgi:hypothetical protein
MRCSQANNALNKDICLKSDENILYADHYSRINGNPALRYIDVCHQFIRRKEDHESESRGIVQAISRQVTLSHLLKVHGGFYQPQSSLQNTAPKSMRAASRAGS